MDKKIDISESSACNLLDFLVFSFFIDRILKIEKINFTYTNVLFLVTVFLQFLKIVSG